MTTFALLLILAQRIHVPGSVPASPEKFHLKVTTVDQSGAFIAYATVTLARLSEADAVVPVVVDKVQVDKTGTAMWTNLPPGRYLISADLTGFISARLGPIPLDESTEIPDLKIMLDTYARY